MDMNTYFKDKSPIFIPVTMTNKQVLKLQYELMMEVQVSDALWDVIYRILVLQMKGIPVKEFSRLVFEDKVGHDGYTEEEAKRLYYSYKQRLIKKKYVTSTGEVEDWVVKALSNKARAIVVLPEEPVV